MQRDDGEPTRAVVEPYVEARSALGDVPQILAASDEKQPGVLGCSPDRGVVEDRIAVTQKQRIPYATDWKRSDISRLYRVEQRYAVESFDLHARHE